MFHRRGPSIFLGVCHCFLIPCACLLISLALNALIFRSVGTIFSLRFNKPFAKLMTDSGWAHESSVIISCTVVTAANLPSIALPFAFLACKKWPEVWSDDLGFTVRKFLVRCLAPDSVIWRVQQVGTLVVFCFSGQPSHHKQRGGYLLTVYIQHIFPFVMQFRELYSEQCVQKHKWRTYTGHV
jgi:hypothetical protein